MSCQGTMVGHTSSFPLAAPIVSTVGADGERALRRFRRKSVADALARYVSQVAGRPAALLDMEIPVGVNVSMRERLVPSALEFFNKLPPAQLAPIGSQLTLHCDDL